MGWVTDERATGRTARGGGGGGGGGIVFRDFFGKPRFDYSSKNCFWSPDETFTDPPLLPPFFLQKGVRWCPCRVTEPAQGQS
eukprot:756670-Hanusia_phi.AAC.1